MTLDDYLTLQKSTNAAFGKLIGVTAECVGHYRKRRRTPKQEIMPRIVAATNGSVTPNDFFTETP